MRLCGIELKSDSAIIVGIETDGHDFSVINEIPKKIKLNDSSSSESINQFFDSMTKVFNAYAFDKVGIKARATKGKFAGGSISFKMEGLIQLSTQNVQVINGATIKSKIKSKIDEIEHAELNSYQKEALKVAVYLMSN